MSATLSESYAHIPKDALVVVGMSGGVDSSVAALLLHRAGLRVAGLFMRNWDEADENGVCAATEDYEDVARVCEKIGIPYYAVDFVEEYRDRVFEEFLSAYRAGYTPNPDVLCNREIKFDAFWARARALGAEYLATGHYCQSESGSLLKGADPAKDQSYFLYAVRPRALERVLFPIGHLPKPEVRRIAEAAGLPTHDKKDSTGICFIGERKFRPFLSQYLKPRLGEFRTLAGEVLGTHQGAHLFTLGQRKGTGIGGPGESPYVVAKDVEKNLVYVERGDRHPALYTDDLQAESLSWIRGQSPELPFRCTAKVRYRQSDQEATVELLECDPVTGAPGQLRVVFDLPQRAVTPGQHVVFYKENECLGGGVIRATGPSYWHQGKALPTNLSL
ncbi:MAG: tRNA 2-thiouridine(34) synthase MnmA [Bdellovibrionales bacterium]|nr:tRNA 2-thiouridine(34) synthase MnmA [Bdellovibrionales bacterium]